METFRAAPCSSFWAVHLVTIPCLFLVICQCQLGFPPRHSYSTSGELLLIPHSHVHQSSKGINFAITPETPCRGHQLQSENSKQPWEHSPELQVGRAELTKRKLHQETAASKDRFASKRIQCSSTELALLCGRWTWLLLLLCSQLTKTCKNLLLSPYKSVPGEDVPPSFIPLAKVPDQVWSLKILGDTMPLTKVDSCSFPCAKQ